MENNKQRKGIILAGGKGTRLLPSTYALSKHLLNLYDKPMIYYSLSILMLGGMREILIISTQRDIKIFSDLLGNGERFGISISYAIQEKPRGIADALIIGESFLNGSPVALVLGDNLLHGNELVSGLLNANNKKDCATIFAYRVNDPKRYGIVEFDKKDKVLGIEEKPENPKSQYAVIGLYYYDKSVVEKVKQITFSGRGELEITSLNQLYLKENNLKVEKLGRGIAWFDTGTVDSLFEASGYIRTLQNRQGLMVGCPEEIAWRNGWISEKKLLKIAEKFKESGYGEYLMRLPLYK